MAEAFIAEIRIFAGNFAPRGWAFCNGALLPIAQNTALFALIGTTYGGDGRTTTALPNLEGRAPMHPGRGPGLTPRTLGEKTGVETVALTGNQGAVHTHTARGTNGAATANDPAAAGLARSPDEDAYAFGATSLMAAEMVKSSGASEPHDNMQPYLAMYFIIALTGTFPSRS